ncbi:chalcone isomerase family protein [Vibrio litoralis]|uniref:chalcone isomerase family protein n=2 Tax=Vibrio litoralis TaxID=335972 RepID=UPI00041D43EB|nr:chalcone isomerase family protein [Vibrio litoralis]
MINQPSDDVMWKWLFIGCLAVSQVGRAQVDSSNLQLVGEARMTYLFWDIYDARLYNPSGDYTTQGLPLLLSLSYLRDFKAKDIIKATNEQWQHLGKQSLVGQYDQELMALWPDIKQGDTLSVLVENNQTSAFFYNGKKLGVIRDPSFTESFIAIWLSPNTSHPKVRKQLIGQ